MADQIRTGKKRDHRQRKNAASREAWLKAKRTERPKQIFHLDGIANGRYEKIPCTA